MVFDEGEFSVEIFRQRGAILNPIAAVHVNDVVQRANFGTMNVTANDTGHPALTTVLDQGGLIIGHVFHGGLGFHLDVGSE